MESFASRLNTSRRALGRFAVREAREWRSYGVERARRVRVVGRKALRPAAVERALWIRVLAMLEGLRRRVEARLDGEGNDGLEALPARDLVARLGELSDDECRLVYDRELRHKRRATVLRALEQRIETPT